MPADYTYKHDIFNLVTCNKQQTFYYRLSKSSECWGNYTARIAFYNAADKLIYHRNYCRAHFIKVADSMEFVKWSDDGSAVLFYEIKHGHINHGGIYHYLLLDLKKNVVYRIDLYKFYNEFVNELPNYFDINNVINQITELGIEPEACHTDEIKPKRFNLFGNKKFLPYYYPSPPSTKNGKA